DDRQRSLRLRHAARHPAGICSQGANGRSTDGRLPGHEPHERSALTMFGKLTLAAIPLDQPIIMGTCAVLLIVIAFVLGLLTWLGRWKWLWDEWLTTVDHKRVGIMYVLLAVVMLLRGFSDAIMMRSQQALAAGGGAGFLPPEHYDQ